MVADAVGARKLMLRSWKKISRGVVLILLIDVLYVYVVEDN